MRSRSAPSPSTSAGSPSRSRPSSGRWPSNGGRKSTPGAKATPPGWGRAGPSELTVSDDGRGIDRHSRTRVFERFYTGDSVGGSGLGLAIAHELALRMGGGLAVSSRRGRTDFVLELPALT